MAFINSQTGKKILILKDNDKLADNKKNKALERIKLYGLGDCNPQSQTQKCRIELDKRDNPELLEKYGFLEFLKRGQFVVVV